MLRAICKAFALGTAGGAIYMLIELLWRGHTHPAMALIGAVAFVLIGRINETYRGETPLLAQMYVAAVLVTMLELFAGLILNVWLGLGIWDYSSLRGNVLGQICPQFMLAWFVLSLPAILLDDWLRWKLFGEEKPHYTII